MQFAFTDEQQELRRAARRFLESVSSTERVRTAMETEQGYDPEVWQRVAEELGWLALTIPEQYGGIGMSYLDLHPLMEEMGRHVLCAPFFSTVCLGANALLVAGTEAQKKEHLPTIASGAATATLAHTEQNGRADANGIETTFKKDGSDYVLRGEKYYVIDGHTADLLIVAARSEGTRGTEGVSLFLVPGDTSGVTRQWLPTMDQTRRQGSVTLNDVCVPASALMGDEGKGWAPLCRTIDLATTALAAVKWAAQRCVST